MRTTKECELCLTLRIIDSEETICADCDAKMAFDQHLEDLARKEAHGKKYKCKGCAMPLGLDRAQYCTDCRPELVSDNPYFADMYCTDGINEDGSFYVPVRHLQVVPTEFTCGVCEVTKPIAECAPKKRKHKIEYGRCKACHRERERQYRASALIPAEQLQGVA